MAKLTGTCLQIFAAKATKTDKTHTHTRTHARTQGEIITFHNGATTACFSLLLCQLKGDFHPDRDSRVTPCVRQEGEGARGARHMLVTASCTCHADRKKCAFCNKPRTLLPSSYGIRQMKPRGGKHSRSSEFNERKFHPWTHGIS
jgi:hypothetical protein